MTALTPQQYEALDKAHIDKIQELYQLQLNEQEQQRAGLRAKARYDRLKELEIEQQRKTVDEEVRAQEMAAYQTAVGPKAEISKTHRESIVKNAKKKVQLKERQKEVERREKLQTTEEEKLALDAELEYLNSAEHKKQLKLNADLKAETLRNQQRAQDVELFNAQTRKLQENQAELYVQQQMYGGNLSPTRRMAITAEMQNAAVEQVIDRNNQRQITIEKLDGLINSTGGKWNEFLSQNPKYSNINMYDRNNIPLELVNDLYSDFDNFIDRENRIEFLN